jgi:hypothetical protein
MVVVKADYRFFDQSIDFCESVEKLLSFVPAEYLAGLGSVAIRETSSMPAERRRRLRATGFATRGVYVPSVRNREAHIDLYLDAIISGWPYWFLRRRVIREAVLAKTLFHEIGHHIHDTLVSDAGNPEAVATLWHDRLRREYLRKRYWYLMPVARPLRWLLRSIRRLIPR